MTVHHSTVYQHRKVCFSSSNNSNKRTAHESTIEGGREKTKSSLAYWPSDSTPRTDELECYISPCRRVADARIHQIASNTASCPPSTSPSTRVTTNQMAIVLIS